MSNSNYIKAWFVLAKPAFLKLNKKQREVHTKLIPLVGDLSQGKNLNIPMSPEIIKELDKLSIKEMAELARVSYLVGDWHPGNTEQLFLNSKGESWKISNCIDQILKNKIELPHNVLIGAGGFRVFFSSKECWLWEEFSLATIENLEIFKKCGLSFGENTLEKSTKTLKNTIGDLWPDVDSVPDNKEYIDFLESNVVLANITERERSKKNLLSIKRRINTIKTELKGFTWLYDHNISERNCIFYGHTEIFTFGWLDTLSEIEKESLKVKLIGFPFKYELNN